MVLSVVAVTCVISRQIKGGRYPGVFLPSSKNRLVNLGSVKLG